MLENMFEKKGPSNEEWLFRDPFQGLEKARTVNGRRFLVIRYTFLGITGVMPLVVLLTIILSFPSEPVLYIVFVLLSIYFLLHLRFPVPRESYEELFPITIIASGILTGCERRRGDGLVAFEKMRHIEEWILGDEYTVFLLRFHLNTDAMETEVLHVKDRDVFLKTLESVLGTERWNELFISKEKGDTIREKRMMSTCGCQRFSSLEDKTGLKHCPACDIALEAGTDRCPVCELDISKISVGSEK